MKNKILVSVSGGETSATMAKLLKEKGQLTPISVFKSKGKPLYTKYVNNYEEYIFVFANMSREDNRTLTFVNRIENNFKIKIIWVEAVVNDGRKGTTHRIVTCSTAKRDGSVFESIIAKYGIPNKMYIHCTREGKQQAITSFAKSIGWKDYITSIGYRADEPKRVNMFAAAKNKQWYPLFEWRITKTDIKAFWSRQSFGLGLLEFEGNCRLCYKKSKRKLLSQIVTDPSSTEWIKNIESKYRYFEKAGRSAINKEGTLFFRSNESIHDLIEESKQPFDMWTAPVKIQSDLFDVELDEQETCAESCEPFAIETNP